MRVSSFIILQTVLRTKSCFIAHRKTAVTNPSSLWWISHNNKKPVLKTSIATRPSRSHVLMILSVLNRLHYSNDRLNSWKQMISIRRNLDMSLKHMCWAKEEGKSCLNVAICLDHMIDGRKVRRRLTRNKAPLCWINKWAVKR